MYSIFFNNRRLQLCRPDSPVCLLPCVRVESPDIYRSWEDLIVHFECDNNLKHLVVPVKDPYASFRQICNHFVVIPAAGGIVTNPSGFLLMIYRYGKWDLPKGKQEVGETLLGTALREVTEETGVQGLELLEDKFSTTYHSYHYHGNNVLKMTAWFKMITRSESSLLPQTEEGIEKAEWVPASDLEERLEASYASIRMLVGRKFLDDGKDIGETCQIEDILDLGSQIPYR
ncbi:MAG: NUDIX domain-containing protein [Bacteroidales bacterium]|jgi:8-oxo-dGTP pyrophosphatase MutT (NUDIX family)|nr:NUDIX domain-containing protein [Bacteroidales bacterium]MDD4168417.1 NUDIX domain-containing protein [Bacteroidales bacterium]MDD5046421.1 NUDIX domain-containing protein [Bacteroidales bacterium]MDY0353214.1 NUDIX domain-containing protein [Bacteroidales bacterium]HHV04065.1 NUDIX domain-containing protein [Bacteroidales bacterium]